MSAPVNSLASSPACPICHSTFRQIKNGHTVSGSPLMRCVACRKTYNLAPKKQGYPESLRHQAVKMYVEGINFRRIGRLLGVNHQTVVNWVNAYHRSLPPQPDSPPDGTTAEVIEMDALFTFVGEKNTKSTW
jgi:transposase-like protein